jgi:serine/threonine protein kinase
VINGTKVSLTSVKQQKDELVREKELGNLYQQITALLSSNSTPSDAETGLKLYKRGSEIGRGATGVAYIVKHKKTKIEYCDKQIDKSKLQEHVTKQVMKEVDILSRLHHDNIISLIEYFDNPNELHLILELYVTKQPLC